MGAHPWRGRPVLGLALRRSKAWQAPPSHDATPCRKRPIRSSGGTDVEQRVQPHPIDASGTKTSCRTTSSKRHLSYRSRGVARACAM